MRTNETIEVKGAIVVTKHALEEINQLIMRIGKERSDRLTQELGDIGNMSADTALPSEFVKYSGALSDGTQVQFESFSELISYPNRSSRHLVRLAATLQGSTSDDFKMEITIGGSDVPCVVAIDGDHRDTLHAKDLAKDIISRISVGYGWLYWFSPGFFLFTVIVGGGLGVYLKDEVDRDQKVRSTILKALEYLPPDPYLEKMKAQYDTSVVADHTYWGILDYQWIWALVVLFVFVGCARFLWPRLVFEIGQEIERSERRKAYRRWVVTGLILAIAVSILGRYLGKQIGL